MASTAPKIDRQTTTPFLLRLFYRSQNFIPTADFAPNNPTPPSHVQIYTWPTCTLRELTTLLTSALPNLLPSPAVGTRLAFRLVFPDTRAGGRDERPGSGRYQIKELGSVVVGGAAAVEDDSEQRRELEALEGDAEKTLQDARFVIGDYVSVAIFPPLSNGDIASVPAIARGSGGVREGGYSARGAGMGPRDYGRDPGFGGRGGGFGRGGGGAGGYGGRDGGRDGGRGNRFGGDIPPGEWRRGERLPDSGPGFNRGRGRGRGGW